MDKGRLSRRSSSPVETSAGTIEVFALPWRKRNDLGDFIVQTFSDAINESLRVLKAEKEGDAPTVQADLLEKRMDWDGILNHGFAGSVPPQLEEVTFSELITVLKKVLEVNGLEQQFYMIDPKFEGQSEETGAGDLQPSTSSGSEEAESGQKTESSADSGPLDIRAKKSKS